MNWLQTFSFYYQRLKRHMQHFRKPDYQKLYLSLRLLNLKLAINFAYSRNGCRKTSISLQQTFSFSPVPFATSAACVATKFCCLLLCNASVSPPSSSSAGEFHEQLNHLTRRHLSPAPARAL